MNDMTDQTGSQEPAIDETITHIGRSMGRMRLMIGRRFIGKLAISRVGASMELSHLDVIAMVRRLENGQEATIGAIADQLRVDPSRSSRIVADLVRQGLLRREASQEDARRTIVVITPLGQDLLERLDEVKRETIREIVSGWPKEDIERFAELYDRFLNGFDRRLQQFEAENADQAADGGMAYGTARAASRE